ncbi:MAG: PilZ domain-containing protein [Candidatus Omnitrophota bacterium]|nr:MAG: PilZ domain-containing protein [Candidatus Omnitrophota bacterium]
MEERKDKRAAPRVRREVIVQYRIKELPEAKGLRVGLRPHADITRTKDLSETGIRFTVSDLFPLNTILEINLRLPSERVSVELEGRIVGCEEIKKNIIYAIRIEFVNLGDQRKKELRRFTELFLKG